MAFNPFIGRELDWLVAQLQMAQEDYAAGKSITSTAEGGGSISTRSEMSPQKRIEMLYRALNLIDPTTYPIESIVPITRTRAVFSSTDET